jgi:hypothetical protein
MANSDNNQPTHTTINKTSGTSTGFIIGALLVVALVLGYFVFSGANPFDTSNDVNVTVEGAGAAANAVEGAADAVKDAATGN